MTEAAPTKSDSVRSRLLLGLLVSVVAIVVAMFVAEWWPMAKRRQLAAEIEKAGGRVAYCELPQYEQTQQVGFIRRLLQLSLGVEYFAEVDAVSLKPRSGDDAQMILAFPNLRSLHLNDETVTDEFLLKLKGLKELSELRLENVKLGDQAQEVLQQHPRLVTLRLKQCSLSAPLLNTIRGMKDIFTLTIEQCTAAEGGWQALHGAQSNLDLNISEQAISEADILALHAANPGWRIHFATPKDRTDSSTGGNFLPSVNELPKTPHLRFSGPNVTDATLAAVKSASELTSLELRGCQITENGMRMLRQFPKLMNLTILDIPITDDGAQYFAGLKQLEFLHLERTRLEGTTLGILSPSVKNLAIFRSEITDAGVASISQLTGLEVLSLGSQRITDACTNNLSKLKSLKIVEFYQTPVSATARDRLQATLPGCTVSAY